MIQVLIIEDDPMVAELNKRYLERIQGYTIVAMASNVKDALEAIQKHSIDLILLDIFMPGKNGLELLMQILNSGKAIDVIVISAASDMQSIRRALRYGAVDYLIKPFEYERFQNALEGYKEDRRFMENKDRLSQEELDKHLFYRDMGSPSAPTSELPKGLTRNTMARIWDDLQARGKPFTAEEVAISCGISRVSIQKYLYFFSYLEILTSETNYGSVGRPVTRYRVNEEKIHKIQGYL
ncbi:response regulator [Paenibacillus turpanensis]|uniref:response regulator n=1 Tax=Paenibacillus turpanensis TaxID=2689078 RepID=UPI00140762F3|nr:response regulator [Paenibacillus turpanensis]